MIAIYAQVNNSGKSDREVEIQHRSQARSILIYVLKARWGQTNQPCMQAASAFVADGVQLSAVSNDKTYTPSSMAKLMNMKFSSKDQGKKGACLCIETGERTKSRSFHIGSCAAAKSSESSPAFPRETSIGARCFNSPTLHSPYALLSIARLAVVKAEELGILTPLRNAILRPTDSHPTTT